MLCQVTRNINTIHELNNVHIAKIFHVQYHQLYRSLCILLKIMKIQLVLTSTPFLQPLFRFQVEHRTLQNLGVLIHIL